MTTSGAVGWRVGDVVDGRYRVARVHEQGGMGVVYRVRHLAWEIDLAVKSPRPEVFRGAADQERFVAEAETWVSLGLHPHVCHCYYVRVLDGVPRVFAEYVEGGSLHDWIRDRRLYEGAAHARILDIAIQTAWGLEHAHGHGLVHRDVKPANVLLDADGVTAKITDFGLARARDLAVTLDSGAPPGTSLLAAGGSGLTPLYASPEQASGEPVGRRTDIYSFAVSVLEMCVGEATWMTGLAAGAALEDYRADGAVAIPPGLGDLLERCLRANPADRPGSMADVAAELIDIYRDVTGEAYPRPAPALADLLTDELNNRAVSLLDLDRHVEADQVFAQALAADPQNARAIYNAGLARWRRGAVSDDAFLDEIEATRADTGDPWEVRFVLAQIHLERGDLGTARELLGELARQRPDEAEIAEALTRAGSGEIVDARAVQSWQVPWPKRPPPRSLWVQTRNSKDVVPLALTPNGRLLAAGGWDGAVRVFDVHSGQRVGLLKGHRTPVHAVDLTPDGRFAVSVSDDETVWFWELTKRKLSGSTKGRRLYASPTPPSWAGDDDRFRSGRGTIRITEDGRRVLYTGADHVFRVWDVDTGRMTVLDDGASDQLVAVSADGRRAMSVRSLRVGHGREDVVRLWDLPSGQCVRELTPGHKPSVSALCFSADGRYAATGGFDDIRLWDLEDGRRVRTLASRSTPKTLALTDDARFLLSGSDYENSIRWWELDEGRCLRTFPAHRDGTTTVRCDPDGRFAFSAGQDGTVRRWALPAGYRGTPLLSRPRAHVELSLLGGRVDALVGAAEQELAAGRYPAALDLLRQARAVDGYERAPRVMAAWWTLARHARRTEPRAAWSSRVLRVGKHSAVDLSGDGGLVAVADAEDGTIRLWDVESGTCSRVLAGHRGVVRSVRFSPDARRLLSSDKDGVVRLWDVGTGGSREVLTVDRKLHQDDRVAVRFSAYGGHVVLSGPDSSIRLLGGDRPREIRTLYGSHVREFHLSDDGRLSAVIGGSQVLLWDLERDQAAHHLRSGSALTTVTGCLSADGRLAIAGDFNGGLRLWDTARGDVIRTFEGPEQRGFHTVLMTADGRFAVSGGYWSPPTVWDVHSGRSIRVLDGHELGANGLVLTPDGRFVLAKQDGYLRLWELDWELAAREATDWDDGAAPYVEAFLRACPQWTDDDLADLVRRLQDVGHGRLRTDGVRARCTGLRLG